MPLGRHVAHHQDQSNDLAVAISEPCSTFAYRRDAAVAPDQLGGMTQGQDIVGLRHEAFDGITQYRSGRIAGASQTENLVERSSAGLGGAQSGKLLLGTVQK